MESAEFNNENTQFLRCLNQGVLSEKMAPTFCDENA
jgi:hypothetical protein